MNTLFIMCNETSSYVMFDLRIPTNTRPQTLALDLSRMTHGKTNVLTDRLGGSGRIGVGQGAVRVVLPRRTAVLRTR